MNRSCHEKGKQQKQHSKEKTKSTKFIGRKRERRCFGDPWRAGYKCDLFDYGLNTDDDDGDDDQVPPFQSHHCDTYLLLLYQAREL